RQTSLGRSKIGTSQNSNRSGSRIRRRLPRCINRTVENTGQQPCRAGKNLGISEVSPPGGDCRKASLGLRAVSSLAQNTCRDRSEYRQHCAARLGAQLWRDTSLPQDRKSVV